MRNVMMLPMPKDTKMRKLIIAGSHAQWMDYLRLAQLHPKAAPEINRGEDLSRYDPEYDEIVLVGTYHDNQAYQSREYWAFQGYQVPTAIAV